MRRRFLILPFERRMLVSLQVVGCEKYKRVWRAMIPVFSIRLPEESGRILAASAEIDNKIETFEIRPFWSFPEAVLRGLDRK